MVLFVLATAETSFFLPFLLLSLENIAVKRFDRLQSHLFLLRSCKAHKNFLLFATTIYNIYFTLDGKNEDRTKIQDNLKFS